MPGSFDVRAKEHFAEGLRVPPIRIWDEGRYRWDIVQMIVSNTRAPSDAEGDLHAQAEATRVAEREILRLIDKYGRETVITAFSEVQDYVERLTRQRVAELPDGTWETEDYMDYDPSVGEGMIPIKVKLTIEGDQIHYDLSGSHPTVGSFLNSCYGTTFSGVIAGTKTFFPDVPLNSGFYRVVSVDLGPEGTVVNATWPTAVTGFCSGPYEKIMNAIFELWSKIIPERALACSFNLEYLLVGGRDSRRESKPIFMWYDWMVGGWGGRNGRDGSNGTAPIFGVGLAVQPLEGQERLCPVLTTGHEFVTDSGGPGTYRGGIGVEKGAHADRGREHGHVLPLRPRAVDHLGNRGRPAVDPARRLAEQGHRRGTLPRGRLRGRADPCRRHVHPAVGRRRRLRRPARARPGAGEGGRGRRLRLDRAGAQGLRRRRQREWTPSSPSTRSTSRRPGASARASRSERLGWLDEDPESVAERFRAGELDTTRRRSASTAVILDWGTGELLPKTTETFRAMVRRRAAAHWPRGRGGRDGVGRSEVAVSPETVRVAAVQAAPVFLDGPATVEKAVALVEEATANGAKLVAFPETWIPGYPAWIFGAAGWDDPQAKKAYRRLHANSVEVPSPETEALCRAARAGGAVLVVGMTERDGGSLYNSLLYVSDRGELLGVHRKLMPTHAERIVWGLGDGSTLARVRHRRRTRGRPRLLGALDAARALRHARQGRADPHRRLARGREPRAAPLRQPPLRLRGAVLLALRDRRCAPRECDPGGLRAPRGDGGLRRLRGRCGDVAGDGDLCSGRNGRGGGAGRGGDDRLRRSRPRADRRGATGPRRRRSLQPSRCLRAADRRDASPADRPARERAARARCARGRPRRRADRSRSLYAARRWHSGSRSTPAGRSPTSSSTTSAGTSGSARR